MHRGSGDLCAYLSAIRSGKRADFDALVTGRDVPLVDPQAGLAFDLETCDPSQNSIPPFATLTSKDFAAQMVEAYWLALTRDVPFSQWGTDSDDRGRGTELTGSAGVFGPAHRRQCHAANHLSRISPPAMLSARMFRNFSSSRSPTA